MALDVEKRFYIVHDQHNVKCALISQNIAFFPCTIPMETCSRHMIKLFLIHRCA